MKKHAFTLAEVLITLSVIGIVAALTIPNLVQNYKKREYSSKLKKFYSTFSQVITLSELENGPVSTWDLPTEFITDEDGNYDVEKNSEIAVTFINKYLKPYFVNTEYSMEDSKIFDTPLEGKYPQFTFADGSILYIGYGSCMDFIYDVDGLKGYNNPGQDRYRFLICSEPNNHRYFKNDNVYWGVYLLRDFNTRDKALEGCKENGALCSGLLLYDGWEFKEDYPYKL